MDIATTKRLGNGVELPILGLGVFKSGQGKAPREAVRTALEIGYRHVDTASIYGNEAEVGQGLRDSGLPRDRVFITTKLWNEDQRRGRQREAFEESLVRLGTDYIDLYLIHWPVPGRYIESWKVLEELYRSGRVRAIGVSNFSEVHLSELLEVARLRPVANQIELHPRLPQGRLVGLCGELGMAVESWSPLGGEVGDLLGDPTLISLAARLNRTVAQVILRWDLQRGLVTIPKSVRPERIAENADLFGFELSASDMETIAGLDSGRRFGPDPEHFDF